MEPPPNPLDRQPPQQEQERAQDRQAGSTDNPSQLSPVPSPLDAPSSATPRAEVTVSQSDSGPNVYGPVINSGCPDDPAMTDFSSALNNYVLTQSSPASEGHAWPPIPIPPQPSHFSHSPQSAAARPATASRRATISFGPSHLYRPGLSSFSGGAPPQAVLESPPSLDAAYRLLIGWGNTAGSVETLNGSSNQHQLESPHDLYDVNEDHSLAQRHASHLPWSSTVDEPPMGYNVDPSSSLDPSFYTPASTSSVLGDTRTCTSQFVRHSPELRDGQPISRYREAGSIEQPHPVTYHRPRPLDWDQSFENHHVSLLRPTPDADVDAYPCHSLLVPLIQNFPLHPPSQSQHAAWPSDAHLTHGSGYSYAPINYEHQLSGFRDPDPEQFSSDGGLSIIASASPLANPFNPELRRESDPSPIVPVAQRPWGYRHRYSIANFPMHLPLEKRFVDNQFFEPTNTAYAPGCSNSVSSHQSSSMVSKLNLNRFDSTPATSFRNPSLDHEPRSAFRRYQKPFSACENTSLDSSLQNQNATIDAMDSPQGAFSFHSKSDGFYSPENGPLQNTAYEGASAAVYKIVDTPGDSRVTRERSSPVNFLGNLESSNQPADAFIGSDNSQILSDHINVFQGYTLPFGNPHRSRSPYASCGSFISNANFPHVPNQIDTSESPPHPSGYNAHQLPQMDGRDSQQQRQNRLRRLSIMTQPEWSESIASPQGLQPSSNPTSPQSLQGTRPTGRSLPTRKRKSMKKEKRSPSPLVEESETETYHSFEKLPGATPPRPDGSPENKKAQTYDLTRFGGIGQGISPYPPGLIGKSRPSDLDLEGILDENGEKMIPWRQQLRCDEDLYTPMWCRAQNDRKEGFCDMCEGGAWFRLKNSAYWYHKQYFHGVSSTTGHYFYPPLEIKRGFSTANRQQILGLCHECNEWVGYCSIVGGNQIVTKKNDKVVDVDNDKEENQSKHANDLLDLDDGPGSSRIPTLWYKHAHKCHRHQTCKGAKGRKKSKKN